MTPKRTDTTVLPKPDASRPKVAILLCTYQGEKFLCDQLESFAAQGHGNWVLWASDDGSQDATLSILRRYQSLWGADRLNIVEGPGTRGHCMADACRNFLSLVHNPDIHADYYAYSDQDDVWEPDKLQRALTQLAPYRHHIPALYCSRTRYIDEHNQGQQLSRLFLRRPGFANALTQNIAGGDTMLFNEAACALLREVGQDTDVVIHDWWTYLVISACGGRVLYDSYPSVRYRQHSANLIGMNTSLPARMRRVHKLIQGHFKDWSDQNVRALEQVRSRITAANLRTLDEFSTARQRALLPRLAGLKRSGIYRQTRLGNIGLVVGALINKL